MKLWISMALVVALLVACVTVRLGGRTVWGHAKDHGVPQATGRLLVAGAHGLVRGTAAAWTWMTARPEEAKGVAAPAPKRAARRDEQKPARQTLPASHFRTGAEREVQTPDELAPQAPAAPAPTGILEAPPAEKLSAMSNPVDGQGKV